MSGTDTSGTKQGRSQILVVILLMVLVFAVIAGLVVAHNPACAPVLGMSLQVVTAGGFVVAAIAVWMQREQLGLQREELHTVSQNVRGQTQALETVKETFVQLTTALDGQRKLWEEQLAALKESQSAERVRQRESYIAMMHKEVEALLQDLGQLELSSHDEADLSSRKARASNELDGARRELESFRYSTVEQLDTALGEDEWQLKRREAHQTYQEVSRRVGDARRVVAEYERDVRGYIAIETQLEDLRTRVLLAIPKVPEEFSSPLGRRKDGEQLLRALQDRFIGSSELDIFRTNVSELREEVREYEAETASIEPAVLAWQEYMKEVRAISIELRRLDVTLEERQKALYAALEVSSSQDSQDTLDRIDDLVNTATRLRNELDEVSSVQTRKPSRDSLSGLREKLATLEARYNAQKPYLSPLLRVTPRRNNGDSQ